MESKLQHSEIRLSDFKSGWVTVEPAREPYNRAYLQVQFNDGNLALYRLSPEEAYTVGGALQEHAVECGYDPDTGDTHRGH